MTKEEALKKIEELKEYVEKCEEKEKEIPEMSRHGNYNIHIMVPDKPHSPYISWERSFENEESAKLYCILSFELANLIYVRNYLGVKSIDMTEPLKSIWHVWFCPSDKKYRWSRYLTTLLLPDIVSDAEFAGFGWFFENEDDAQRVCNYMNKYVAHVKENMLETKDIEEHYEKVYGKS